MGRADLVLCEFQGLLQVGQQVVPVLGADGQPDGAGENSLLRLFLREQLGVGGGGWVDDQALGVGHVGQQREQLQVVDEAEGPPPVLPSGPQ